LHQLLFFIAAIEVMFMNEQHLLKKILFVKPLIATFTITKSTWENYRSKQFMLSFKNRHNKRSMY